MNSRKTYFSLKGRGSSSTICRVEMKKCGQERVRRGRKFAEVFLVRRFVMVCRTVASC